MKKYLLVFLAVFSLCAVLAPMGVSAQGNSEAAKLCQQGGFVNWSDRLGGPPFADTGECVSTAAHGTIYPVPIITIERDGISDIYGQSGNDLRYCFYWVTYYNLDTNRPFDISYYHDGVLESVSGYIIVNGVPTGDIVPYGVTQVIVVTDELTGEVLATGMPQVCELQ